MRIKAKVKTDNGGYEVLGASTLTDPIEAIREFIADRRQCLIPGSTYFMLDGGLRFRWSFHGAVLVGS